MKKSIYFILVLIAVVFATSCTTSRGSSSACGSLTKNFVGYN